MSGSDGHVEGDSLPGCFTLHDRIFGYYGPLIGIAAPAAHYIHLLSENSRKIVDAPKTLDSHRKDILSVEQVLASLQTISGAQRKVLGEIVTNHLKATDRTVGSPTVTIPRLATEKFFSSRIN